MKNLGYWAATILVSDAAVSAVLRYAAINGNGYVAEYEGELLELDGHEISAVFTYLDIRPLLARAGHAARQRFDGPVADVTRRLGSVSTAHRHRERSVASGPSRALQIANGWEPSRATSTLATA